MDKKTETLTKAEVMEKILKDDSRGVRLIPGPGYSHKMQTIRRSSLDMLPTIRAVGSWHEVKK